MPVDTLHALFLSVYKQFLNNCAIIYSDGETEPKKITYKQLACECLKVTKCLQELSVTGFVGVSIDPDISFPTIILGILHCELPFVFIDTSNSEESIHNLLKYLNIKWIIHKKNCSSAKFSNIGCEVFTFCVNEENYVVWNVSNHLSKSEDENIFHKSLNLAYAIQTSGSTGIPKIIRVPHRCIVPNIVDIGKLLEVQQKDVFFLGSPLTFDPSIIEIFVPLFHGAALLITPSSIRVSPTHLLDVLFPSVKEHFSGITILQITPSSFSRWTSIDIKTRILSNTSSLKKLLFGGEPCPSIHTINKWRENNNETEIFNVYGITEVSCWASLQKIELSSSIISIEETLLKDTLCVDVPLGSSLSETEFRIHDFKGKQIFTGEGELYIGSASRVCLVNEEVMRELMLPVFRATGDIVKFDEQKRHLIFVGRKNRLIKRWGHQVCLTNIEKSLGKHPSVRSCICVWNQSRHILAAIIIWNNEEEILNLRKFCNAHLHKAAVPDLLITVKNIPLTKHGKVDHEALQLLVLKNNDSQCVDQKDSPLLPSLLLNAWENVLGRKPHQTDNFITSGGNSLLAIQLSSELEKFYGEDIRNNLLTLLFNNSSFIDISENLISYANCNKSNFDTNSKAAVNSKAQENTVGESSCIMESEIIHSVQTKNADIFNRKRKLPNISEISKEENLCLNDRAMILKNEVVLSTCENKLVSVYCRGKIVLNEQIETISADILAKNFSLKFNWKFNMLKCIDASPTCLKFLRNSWVTVGSHSHLLIVLDCSTGKLISKCELPDRIESNVCPSSCGKYGVVGCYDGCVYCISLINGMIKWCFRTKDMVKSSPSLCHENTAIVVGSYDSNLYCINLLDGKLIWKTSASSGSIYSTPCVSVSGSIFYGTLDGLCVAVSEQTGLIYWEKKVSSPIFSSPTLLISSNSIVFAEVIGIVHGFAKDDGRKMWVFKANGNIFSSINSLYFTTHSFELLAFGCHDKNVYCLKLENNSQDVILSWKKELDSSVFATPFMFPIRSVFLNMPPNHTELSVKSTFVITATTKGTVYVIEAEQGSDLFSTTLPFEIFSSPIVCDNLIFVGCRDDFLYCFTLNEKDANTSTK